jgi:hypothetical protein
MSLGLCLSMTLSMTLKLALMLTLVQRGTLSQTVVEGIDRSLSTLSIAGLQRLSSANLCGSHSASAGPRREALVLAWHPIVHQTRLLLDWRVVLRQTRLSLDLRAIGVLLLLHGTTWKRQGLLRILSKIQLCLRVARSSSGWLGRRRRRKTSIAGLSRHLSRHLRLWIPRKLGNVELCELSLPTLDLMLVATFSFLSASLLPFMCVTEQDRQTFKLGKGQHVTRVKGAANGKLMPGG